MSSRIAVIDRPFVRNVAYDQGYWYGINRFAYLARPEDTGNDYGLAHARVAAGGLTPAHIHDREDEIIYILRGQAKVKVSDQEFEITQGDIAYLPRGLAHQILATNEFEALVLVTPGDFMGFFRYFSSPARYPGNPLPMDAPRFDHAEMLRMGQQFGITFLAPGTSVNAWPKPEIHAAPKHVSSGEGERLDLGETAVTVKLDGGDTQNLISIFEIEVAPGASSDSMIHHTDSQAFYVLEGAFEVEVDEQVNRAVAGTFAFVPAGSERRLKNYSRSPGKLLMITAKSGYEAFARQVHEVKPENVSEMAIIARRNGMEIVA